MNVGQKVVVWKSGSCKFVAQQSWLESIIDLSAELATPKKRRRSEDGKIDRGGSRII